MMLVLIGLSFVAGNVAQAQTAGGTQISVQAVGKYTYKTVPFNVASPTVTVTVGSLPNFEIHYSLKDSNVVYKDIANVWIVFTNIGNASADTVTIQSTLPPSGTNVVGISNNGTLSGNVISWREFNVASAKRDSFLVQLKIDTTTAGQAVLPMSSILTWQGKSVGASQDLIVGNFARLILTNSTSLMYVGSGRQLDYQLQVSNTGNVKSDSTILIDTISSNGTYAGASITPTSISANKRVVQWNLGTLPAVTGAQNIRLTVQVAPNLAMSLLKNDANVHSTAVASVTAPEVVTTIVPVRPAAMNLTLSEKNVWGSANRDSSDIVAAVSDSLGNPIPDGIPVTFTTTLGFFDNGTRSITAVTSGGSASTYLVSEDVNNVVKHGVITAIAGVVQSGTLSGTIPVTMYPGAVTGIVRAYTRVGSGMQQLPYKGAIAEVFDNVPQLVGSDTTGSDGVFFIPLNKEVMMYTLKIFVIDEFGDTLSASSGMSSDTLFDRKAVKILNTIAGRLQYSNVNSPISVQGVDVFLDSLSASSSGRPGTKKVQGISSPFVYSRIRSTTTDALGRFKFENLEPAVYQVSVDTVRFPNYSGTTVIYDTSGGTFTINLNILVRPTVTVALSVSTQPTAPAGDTIRYVIRYQNLGNIFHSNVVLTDTLPKYTSLISGVKGPFKTLSYDTTQRIVKWTMDSLAVGTSDSVSLNVSIAKNVPDSTVIMNRPWFSSNQITGQSSQALTVVHSAPLMSMQNFVLQNKDSVVAGDSVQFEIWYRNAGTDSLRSVKIVDSVFNAGRSVLRYNHWTANRPGNDTTVVDSVIVWNVGSIPPGKVDSLILSLRTDYTLPTGKKIQTSASILKNGVTVTSASASVVLKVNTQFSTYLQVLKSADKTVAEIGDVVTYQVAITNNSPTLMKGLTIIDQLPHAFKYYARSARYNGVPVEPQALSNNTILQWTLASASRDTLKAGATSILVYQLVLGADAMESQGLNTVYATAKDTVGTIFVAAPSQKQITVQPGVFTEKGLIIGKVFYDDDRDSYQSEGEAGIKGVELWMEDGTRVVTGDDGKFSLPEVKPGQHVLRVNERSLPPRTELLKGGRDFAGDASSRFVRVTESGIARANFFVKRVLKDSIRQKVGKVGKTAALRSGSPRNLYMRSGEAGGKSNLVQFSVHINYSGGTWLQRIQVFDDLPAGFSYVEGSAAFNGRKVSPAVSGNHLTWTLGRGSSLFDGTLQYSVEVARSGAQQSSLESRSLVELMTSDSVMIQTDTLKTLTKVERIPFVESSYPIESLMFAPGESALRKDALKIFQPIINIIKKYHFADIIVVGYPDMPVKQGTVVSGLQKLAEERASVAVDFLSRRIKLDSIRITPCSVFRCDTSKDPMTAMKEHSRGTTKPHDLEIRVQNYFTNGLVLRDTGSSQSQISLVTTLPHSERDFSDSVYVVPGDDLVFKYDLFSNPSAALMDARIVDSTAKDFSFTSGAFTLNQIPIISGAQFNGVYSSSVTQLIKKGKNVMEFAVSVPFDEQNVRLSHSLYYRRMNAFGETSVERSNVVTLYVKGINLSLLENAVKRERELAGKEGTPKATTAN
ncbi:MAG TPA: hypothetical protein VMF88_09200 [Bacteroidota bacterium]|nr:hypothetical protein [Bacteroidota bacterium]